MAGRYTKQEDEMLVAWDGVAPETMAQHDFSRSAASLKKRIAFLKESGVFEHMVRANYYAAKAEVLAGRIPSSAPVVDDLFEMEQADPSLIIHSKFEEAA